MGSLEGNGPIFLVLLFRFRYLDLRISFKPNPLISENFFLLITLKNQEENSFFGISFCTNDPNILLILSKEKKKKDLTIENFIGFSFEKHEASNKLVVFIQNIQSY